MNKKLIPRIADPALDVAIREETTLEKSISAGNVKVSGDKAKLDELLSYVEDFDFWFNIVTP